MILQFRGFDKNWVYEEAESIAISSPVKISGKREYDGKDIELSEAKELSEKIDQEIREATSGSNIVYLTGKPVYQLGYVKVAILYTKNSLDTTYVFDVDREVYLLNGNGKTVRKV